MGIAPGVNLQVFHCHRRGDQTTIEGAVMAQLRVINGMIIPLTKVVYRYKPIEISVSWVITVRLDDFSSL